MSPPPSPHSDSGGSSTPSLSLPSALKLQQLAPFVTLPSKHKSLKRRGKDKEEDEEAKKTSSKEQLKDKGKNQQVKLKDKSKDKDKDTLKKSLKQQLQSLKKVDDAETESTDEGELRTTTALTRSSSGSSYSSSSGGDFVSGESLNSPDGSTEMLVEQEKLRRRQRRYKDEEKKTHQKDLSPKGFFFHFLFVFCFLVHLTIMASCLPCRDHH